MEENTHENEFIQNKDWMEEVADSLVACLYINAAELSNTGDSF